jgi:drug/metabolite transporter (DMT)-like permease
MTGLIHRTASPASTAPPSTGGGFGADLGARRTGIALAAVTAVVSGFSVFVNGRAVGHFDDPTTYTTAKNLVAALAIGALVLARRGGADGAPPAIGPPAGPRRRRVLLATIAVIGGSVPFVLFFEGLARASSSDAAFIHKTLIVWVAVLGSVVLRERLSPLHVAAIVAILVGYASVAGGVGLPSLGSGELLLLAATLCWSVEVVAARALLRGGVPPMTVSAWRMVGGVVLLVGWAVARGAAGDLVGLSSTQWRWVLLTGAFLTAYVITWQHALARAQAVDVTAVLASGAVLTAVLDRGFGGIPIDPLGSSLLLAGGLLVGVAVLRPRWAETT